MKNHWNSALRRGENIAHLLVDGKVPKDFPDGIPPLPGTGPDAARGLPTQMEAAKINNLLKTNPQSSLASLIDFPVTEGTAPRSANAQGGLDALCMLRARTPAELLNATGRLQLAIGNQQTPAATPAALRTRTMARRRTRTAMVPAAAASRRRPRPHSPTLSQHRQLVCCRRLHEAMANQPPPPACLAESVIPNCSRRRSRRAFSHRARSNRSAPHYSQAVEQLEQLGPRSQGRY